MNKMAAKLITISSQILIVSLFLIVLFSGDTKQDKVIIVGNNNLDKMADSVSSLFVEEEMLLNSIDDSVIDPLTEDSVEEQDEEAVTFDNSELPVQEEAVVEDPDDVKDVPPQNEVISVVSGSLTGYGPDCYGCSGITNSGYDVSNTIYYNDPEYGNVRILAADPSFPLYSIFRVSNVPNMESFIAIVLDRGGNVGFGRGTLFDLLFATEKDPNILSMTENVTFEILRSGK